MVHSVQDTAPAKLIVPAGHALQALLAFREAKKPDMQKVHVVLALTG